MKFPDIGQVCPDFYQVDNLLYIVTPGLPEHSFPPVLLVFFLFGLLRAGLFLAAQEFHEDPVAGDGLGIELQSAEWTVGAERSAELLHTGAAGVVLIEAKHHRTAIGQVERQRTKIAAQTLGLERRKQGRS
jgi:hypothetical protein